VFLLALAIVDDIGAIAVIALFYTEDLDVIWMLGAALTFAVTIALGQLGVRHLVVYLVAGVFAWLCLLESGIHPAIAGAMLGLLTPVRPYYEPHAFESTVGRLMLDVATDDGQLPRDDDEDRRAALREIEDVARDSRPVLDRLEQALHPWTSFAIIPLFALANAGIDLGGGIARDAMSSPVSIGVVAGLVLGKPVGIVLFAFVATKIGIAALPAGVRWRELLGVAMVAGIGFTVSIFVSGLAFTDEALVEEAKIGIFAGSLLIATAGCVTLMWLSRPGTPRDASA
jgi:NhaA family Na+:H+ antiporter